MANCHTVLHYSNSVSIFSIIFLPYTLQMLTHYQCPYILIYMVTMYHAVCHKFLRLFRVFFHHAAGIFHCHVLGGRSRISAGRPSLYEIVVLISYTPDRKTFPVKGVSSCNRESFPPRKFAVYGS